MRVIMFRGKRKDNGEWVRGFPFAVQASLIVEGIETWDGERHLIVPETVGQFTGLLDKYGKQIFEGDIMNNAGNVVEYCSDGFCINGDSPLAFWTKTAIIGNIHDDPELLK